MPRKYFRLYDNPYIPGRWELDDLYDETGSELNAYKFMKGMPVEFNGALKVTINRPGMSLDVSHLVGDPVPVVSRCVAEVLTSLAPSDIQLFPVRIESQVDKYYLVNATRTVKCIDERASAEVHYWQPRDACQPGADSSGDQGVSYPGLDHRSPHLRRDP